MCCLALPNIAAISVERSSLVSAKISLLSLSYLGSVEEVDPTIICASLGLRMKFKTLLMSNFDLPLFFNMSKELLAPGGLNAECVQVSVM